MHIHPPATPLATSAGTSIPLYPLSVHINGVQQHLYVEACVSLLDLLRDRLMLTGTKKSCDHGQCGAFIAHDAFQCGYCTPGQLCSGVGLIAEGQAHTRAQVRELIGKVSA